MATRINVTAVRDCPPDEVRAVMSEVLRPVCGPADCGPVGEQLDIREHGGWTWFTTIVWGVSAADLNRGLCRLARPSVQFTTSDGSRWHLTVHGGPGGQVHFLHEFTVHRADPDPAEDEGRQAELDNRAEPAPVDPRLAFLEDGPPPGAGWARTAFDLLADSLAELGGRLPDDFRAAAEGLTYSGAAARYRRWHADQVSAALAAAGIPHDPAAVRAVLLWETVTGAESDNDLGNLPRLLSVLGLGGEWDDWVEQAEAPPPAPEAVEGSPAYEPEPPEDYIGPVLAIHEPLPPAPVAGGPAPVALDDLTLIRFFPEALSIRTIAGTALTVTLPAGSRRVVAPTGEDVGPVDVTPDGFRVGLRNHLWFSQSDLQTHLGPELYHLLFHLPDGAHVDVAFAEAGHPALTQRYRGPVAGRVWQITETYPALTRDAILGGLEIARHADQSQHEARDEAEAEAVVEAAGRDPNLWDSNVRRQGRTVWSESDICGHLSKVFFRHRSAGLWDVAAHDLEAAEQYQEHLTFQRKMRQSGAEAARRRAAPHATDVLLDGANGRYWASDFTQLTGLEQETREKVDAAMAGLGFTHAGDLVAKKQRDVVMRVYAAADGHAYGVLMGKRTMYLGYEFFSRFADGSTLTTTTNGALDSLPDAGVYYKMHPGLEVPALHAKHRAGVERFLTRKGTAPVPLETTLLGVAKELDAAFARRASA